MGSQGLDLEAARLAQFGEHSWVYTERDVILYALSLGCAWSEGRYVYENHEGFQALPTMPVLALYHGALASVDLSDVLPNFNPALLLHGEQYLELKGHIPVSGELVSTPKLLDIKDKGKAAVVVSEINTRDRSTGALIAVSETTTFIRKAGGFGTTPSVKRRAEAIAQHALPHSAPDATAHVTTSDSQAALYRLNGDYNPLHIDPEFAAVGNFERPILHGLCTFGIAATQVMKHYASGRAAAVHGVKGRFAGHVFPRETLEVQMWRTASSTVTFQVLVKERGKVALSNAAVIFKPGYCEQPPAMSRL